MVYHLSSNKPVVQGVCSSPSINQPTNRKRTSMPYDICHDIYQKNKHISNHIYFICGVLSLTIILSESYTYQPDEVCPFSIDIPPYKYIYTPYIIVYVIQNGFVTCIQQYYNIWGMGTEPYIYINGHFRNLKWRYVSTILLAIFSRDIPWNLGLKNWPYIW